MNNGSEKGTEKTMRFPGVFMDVPVREHRAFNHQISLCGEVN